LNSDGINLLQSWISAPDSNHGFILTDTDTTNGADFDCRETSTATNRPKLTVQHTLTVAKPQVGIQLDDTNSSNVVLTWDDDDLNCHYDIYRQTSPYFDPNVVSPLLTLDSPATKLTFDDDAGDSAINHYYKIRARSCDSTSSAYADSNHTGEFDFALQPGATN